MNFEIKLADDLPCTFETGQHGSVKYFFELRITGPLRTILWIIENVTVIPKQVVKWADKGCHLLEPIVLEKTISSMFLGNDTIHLCLKTERRGFEPSEEIKFLVNVSNNTKKHVRSMNLQLIQVRIILLKSYILDSIVTFKLEYV